MANRSGEKLWAFAQGLYLLSALVIYLIACVVPKKTGRWVFGAQRGDAFEGNAKYLFEYVTAKDDIEAAWLTRRADVLKKLRAEKFRCYSFSSLSGLWFAMTSQVAFITHGGNNQRGDLPFFAFTRKTKVLQLWHGIPLKKIGFDDTLFSNKVPGKFVCFLMEMAKCFFPFSRRVQEPDAVIALSEESKKLFSSAFRVNSNKVIVTGYPRNDILFLSRSSESQSGVRVIFMPTFRGGEGKSFDALAVSGFDPEQIERYCAEKRIFIDIKLHPFNLPTETMLDKLEKSRHVRLLDASDVYPLLSSYDALITDYSSVYFDFLLLDRPLIFFPFQHKSFVSKDRELYFDYAEVTPGPKVASWNEALVYLTDLESLEKKYREARVSLKNRFHDFQDAESCERTYQVVKKLEQAKGKYGSH